MPKLGLHFFKRSHGSRNLIPKDIPVTSPKSVNRCFNGRFREIQSSRNLCVGLAGITFHQAILQLFRQSCPAGLKMLIAQLGHNPFQKSQCPLPVKKQVRLECM